MGIRDRFRAVGLGVLDRARDFISEDDPIVEPLEKAEPKTNSLVPQPPTDDPQALYYDPFLLLEYLGWRDRPSALTYDVLKSMVYKTPVYTAIHQTRLSQVRNFCQIQHDPREAGLYIRLRDKDKKPSAKDKIRMRDMEDWLINTGSTKALERDNFETALTKIVDDSMCLDQVAIEIVRNQKGEPADWYAMDGATIRIADVPPYSPHEKGNGKPRIAYVQVYNETIVTDFTIEELCFGVRNPRSDIRVQGYGLPEGEMAANIITSLLHSQAYNAKFFTSGSTPKGLLNLPGLPDKKLRAFQRQWHMVASGILNAWRTPFLNAQDIQYVDLHSSNRDMEFSEWMNFLIKIFCAICKFDPAEINFIYGNTGQKGAMFQSPVEQRIKESKDRGLRPILRAVATWFNRYLIWPLAEEYELAFSGIDPRAIEHWTDISKKQVTFMKTVDECRAEFDLEPMPDGKGEVILDPTWLQFNQQQEMAAQQEEGAPEEDQTGGMLEQWPGDESEMEEEGGEMEAGGEEEEEEARKSSKPTSRVHELRKGRKIYYDIEV